MWGRRKEGKHARLLPAPSILAAQCSKPDAAPLLSLSGLGRQQAGAPLGSWFSHSPSRLSSRGGGPGSMGQGDALAEVVSSHDQSLQSLSERVLRLEDVLERVQADVLPALKAVVAMRSSGAKQQQDGGDAPKPQPAAGMGPISEGDAASPSKDQAGPGRPEQQPGGEVDQAVSRALVDLAHMAARTGGDRDETGSMRSWCTSISCGSTQVSGLALMTDLRPAGKAPSRAPQAYLAQQQQQAALIGLGGWGEEKAACRTPRARAGGCSSWPLGLHEELGPDEIAALIQDLSAAPPEGSSNSNSSSSGGGGGQRCPQQRLQECLAVLCLHSEASEDVRQQLCAAPGLLARVTAVLQDASAAPCQASAAHLVWFISRSQELRPHLAAQAALLPALLALLSGPDPAAARAGAFALNNLAHDPCSRGAMVEAGAVPGLLDMLSGSDALGQEAAASALMMLASEEPHIRATIVACNGVQALVTVLRWGGPAAQEAAAAALENLSLDAACEGALAAEGAVEGLLQVLRDGTAGAQAAAAGALRNLAVNDELEPHLLAAGAVPVLVGLAGSSKEDVGTRTAALEGLRNLAASSQRAGDALVQAGGAGALVDAARSMPAASARAAALGALLVLSMDDSQRRAILAAGAAGVLVHAALSGSPLGKEYAARGLANLATSEAARADLLREGAATVLAFLLRSQLAAGAGGEDAGGGSSCALAAARALQNLSKSRLSCKALIDAGCIPALAQALASPGAVASAGASALCHLCTSRRALAELAQADGACRLVAAVARPTHLSPRGQRQALRLLRRLLKSGSCRGAAQVQEQVAALGLQLV